MAGTFPFAVQNLKSLSLKKQNGNTLQILPWNAPVSPLITLSLNESIFAPLMTGTLVVKDTGTWFQQNRLNAFDEIQIQLQATTRSGDLNRDSTESPIKTYNLEFTIVNVKNTVNLALNDYQNESENIKTLTIEFITKSVLNQEFLISVLENENFIGPIMSGDGDSFTMEGSEPVSIVMKGFNTHIKDKLGIDLDFDRTWNYCYLKRNNVSYPWGKIKGQPTILQTLQYLAENAVDYYNNQAVNYMFWQDLDGYHFRSIESLLDQHKDDNIVYTTNGTEMATNNIHSLETISEFDGLNLLNSKSYFSWYERVIPDYADPYLDFVDTADGLTRQNIIYKLKDEYNAFNHLNEISIIPKIDEPTDNYSQLVQSNRVDDEIYGFYSKNRYNTPFPQEWEYLGISADTRLSNVTWQNQFDIDDEVYPEVLYVYDKFIKNSVEKNREKYTRLKNAKRKWEVYRCSVCCIDQQGGTADLQIISGLTAGSKDYLYYFGATGVFGDIDGTSDYAIVAAGSFSDVVNYNSGSTFNNGLTLSYDINSYPFNQTIADFYHLENDIEETNKLIDDALSRYVTELDKANVLIPRVEDLLSKIDGWLIEATEFAYTNLTPDFLETCNFADRTGPGTGNDCCSSVAGAFSPQSPCTSIIPGSVLDLPSESTLLFYKNVQEEIQFDFGFSCNVRRLPLYVNLRYNNYEDFPASFSGHWDALINEEFFYFDAYPWHVTKVWREAQINAGLNNCPNLLNGPRAYELPFQKPGFLYECSKSKLVLGKYLTTHEFGEYKEFNVDREDAWSDENLLNGVNNEQIWCETCLDPLALKLIKNEYVKVLKELKTKQFVLNRLIEKLTLLKPIYQQRYQEFLNRKAFFISKNPFAEGVTGNILNKKSQLSLSNVKSITRKPIRGSKYEILAKRKGITGGAGEYVYKIFFDDDVTRDVGITYNHPYYDQKYKIFKRQNNTFSAYATKNPYDVVKYDFEDAYYFDNEYNEFAGPPGIIPDTLPENKEAFLVLPSGISFEYPAQYTIDPDGSLSAYSYVVPFDQLTNRYNIFKDGVLEGDISILKSPSIEKEKIDSYVRIEFKSPIGLDRLADFPQGFIRDAGSEYFLPYLVQLTVGPSGRQAIQNNIAVIGMDPYGFDVAIKKNKTKKNNSNFKEWGNYWWNSGNKLLLNEKTLNTSDMSLWAENSFENEYTFFQNNGDYFYNVGDDYTEYDNYTNTVQAILRSGIATVDGSSFYSSTQQSAYYFILNQLINSLNESKSYNLPPQLVSRSVRSLFGSVSSVTNFFDSTYEKTTDTNTLNAAKYASYYLLGSHLSKSTKRSWFDFQIPTKVYFDSAISSIGNYTNVPNNLTNIVSPQTLFKSPDLISFIGDEFIQKFQNAVNLQDSTELQQFLEQNSVDNLIVSDIQDNSIAVFKENLQDSIFSADIERFLSGEFLIYKPGLITSEVWKYDIFGDSEYGITKPPVLSPEYDVFGENFSAQFVVFGKGIGSSNICSKLELKCANPDVKVNNTDCPENDPYCNCPAKNLMPKEPEPSYKELAIAYENTKECTLIERFLGKDYLGCMLSDPENTASCGCPEQGKYFPTFLNTLRSNATFYVTPPKTPLRRLSQMTLFNAQKAMMAIFPNDAIKVGSVITISKRLATGQYDLISGRWMVTGISRVFKTKDIATMVLDLSRDSVAYGPPSEASNSSGGISYNRLARIRDSL